MATRQMQNTQHAYPQPRESLPQKAKHPSMSFRAQRGILGVCRLSPTALDSSVVPPFGKLSMGLLRNDSVTWVCFLADHQAAAGKSTPLIWFDKLTMSGRRPGKGQSQTPSFGPEPPYGQTCVSVPLSRLGRGQQRAIPSPLWGGGEDGGASPFPSSPATCDNAILNSRKHRRQRTRHAQPPHQRDQPLPPTAR